MSLIKSIFLQGASILPISLLQKLSPLKLYLPYQHLVKDTPAPHISHLYSFKNSRQFETDLDYTLRHFHPIALGDVLAHQRKGDALPPNALLLTFDDGLSEIATLVAPVLKKKGIPAVFFINNAFIDNRSLFYRMKISLLIDHIEKEGMDSIIFQKIKDSPGIKNSTLRGIKKELLSINQHNSAILDLLAGTTGLDFDNYLRIHQPFLTSEQITALINNGFSIGAHSIHHPYYSEMTPDEQVKESVDSVNDLCNRFALKERVFAFPHSDAPVSGKVLKNIADADIDLLFGIQNQKIETQFNMLHRFNAERPQISLEKQIKAVMLHQIILKAAGRHRVNRN